MNLGMPEILMILVIALIIFGPRKLPELGRSLGQSLAQFRRASEDFKRQWEEEVELENRRLNAPPRVEPAGNPETASSETGATDQHAGETAQASNENAIEQTESAATADEPVTIPRGQTVAGETKRDWM